MDKIIWHCAKLVVEMQVGAVSSIQTRLNMGYNEAVSAIDELERLGIVDGAVGSMPRNVLVKTEDELKKFFDADFITEAESPFTITKNEFYNSFDILNGNIFWISNHKEDFSKKIDLIFRISYLDNEFVSENTLLGGSEYNFSKGAVINILFENDKLLKYEVRLEKGSTFANACVLFDDLLIFEKEKIKIVLIDFKKNNTKIQLTPNVEICDEAKKTFGDFLNKVIELNPKVSGIKTEISETLLSSECYVYLMIDLSNNFHKIGLSNNPKIRENTLQSEKPTIEIIVSKKFINRKIASVFEKTLHTVYESKRIRGEWFNLDTIELNEIIFTLKN